MKHYRPTCDSCARPYYRRNLTEQWTKRNIGHRDGWQKELLRICINCQSVKASQRVLMVANFASPPTRAELKQRKA